MNDEGNTDSRSATASNMMMPDQSKNTVAQVVLSHNQAKSDPNEFRNYNLTTIAPRVLDHYRDMRTYQTVDFYRRMEIKYSFEGGMYRRLMTIPEAFAELEHYVDASDPDLNLPNKLHMLQTAEGIRRAGQPDWMQLTGLLHDMGKIMFLWGTAEDGQDGTTANGKQWALGGDTWVLGCEIPNTVILPHLNQYNRDMQNERYRTKYGMYDHHQQDVGLDQLCLAWGHDEYMYRMLVANHTLLPNEALDMIRYHSAYPLHDQNAYTHLLKPEDEARLEWVRLFNQFDLYTKDEDTDWQTTTNTTVDELWPYYSGLLEKYGLGGKLKW